MARDPIALDVAYTARQLDAMLLAYPELEDDDELRADVFEGESDLNTIMSKLVRRRNERLAAVDGLSGYISDLTERKTRMQRGAEGLKTLMLVLLDAAKLPKLVLPEATVSKTAARSSVVVDDANALPQGFFATERKPLKAEIKTALENGQDVPGARLEMGEPSISVRTK